MASANLPLASSLAPAGPARSRLPAFELRRVGARPTYQDFAALSQSAPAAFGGVVLLVGHRQVLAGLLRLLRRLLRLAPDFGCQLGRTWLYGPL